MEFIINLAVFVLGLFMVSMGACMIYAGLKVILFLVKGG